MIALSILSLAYGASYTILNASLPTGGAVIVGEGYVARSEDSLIRLFTPSVQVSLTFVGPARPLASKQDRPIVGTAVSWRADTLSSAALASGTAVIPRSVLDCDWLINDATHHMPSKEALASSGVALVKHKTLDATGHGEMKWTFNVKRSADWKVVIFVCPSPKDDPNAPPTTLVVDGWVGVLSAHGYLSASEFGHLALSMVLLCVWWGVFIGTGTQLVLVTIRAKACPRGASSYVFFTLAVLSTVAAATTFSAWMYADLAGHAVGRSELDGVLLRLANFALVGAPDGT
jgi:hypothetical protein